MYISNTILAGDEEQGCQIFERLLLLLLYFLYITHLLFSKRLFKLQKKNRINFLKS